ncbi:MAG: hypothetical protein P1U56_04735 [Saprospiraceae bacterium]|nr:hypothetical protein [Saprospiraceae bacterium]
MKTFWYWSIVIVALYAMYASYGLIQEEYTKTHACPEIMTIPFCYIGFVCFTLILLNHIIPYRYSEQGFAIALFMPMTMAINGSMFELFGKFIGPKTSSGIPLSYILLVFCVYFTVAKIYYLKSIGEW